MRRDLDLVRSILLEMEKSPTGYCFKNPEIEGFTEEEIGYHAHLMGQAGLIDAIQTSTMSDESPQALAHAMTWSGHDFLAAVRKQSTWDSVKGIVINPVGDAMFSVVLEWLKKKGLEALGLP